MLPENVREKPEVAAVEAAAGREPEDTPKPAAGASDDDVVLAVAVVGPAASELTPPAAIQSSHS